MLVEEGVDETLLHLLCELLQAFYLCVIMEEGSNLLVEL